MANVYLRMTMRICSAMNAAYNATDCQKKAQLTLKLDFSNSLVCSYPPHSHPHLYFFSSASSRTSIIPFTCFCSFFMMSFGGLGIWFILMRTD